MPRWSEPHHGRHQESSALPSEGRSWSSNLGSLALKLICLVTAPRLPQADRLSVPFTVDTPTCYRAWHIVGARQTWADGPPKRPGLPKGVWGWKTGAEGDTMLSLSFLLLAPEPQVSVPSACVRVWFGFAACAVRREELAIFVLFGWA